MYRMKMMRKHGLYLVLLGLLFLGACRKQSDDALQAVELVNPTKAPLLELSVGLPLSDAEADESLRTVSWIPHFTATDSRVNLGLHGSDVTQGAVLVLRNRNSNGNSDKTYYLEVVLNGNNRREFHMPKLMPLERDIYGTQIKLTRSESWFGRLYSKGSFDQRNKRMYYSPNLYKHDQAFNSLASAKHAASWFENRDQPLTTDWIPFQLYNTFDDDILRFRPVPPNTFTYKPRGVVLTFALENRNSEGRSLVNVGLRSNVLATGRGYYSLALGDLPSLPASTQQSGGGEPVWMPDEQRASNGLYDSGLKTMKNASGGSHTPNPDGKASPAYWDWTPVIWAMPVPAPQGATPRTELYGIHTKRQRHAEDRREAVLWSSQRTPKHLSLHVVATIPQ